MSILTKIKKNVNPKFSWKFNNFCYVPWNGVTFQIRFPHLHMMVSYISTSSIHIKLLSLLTNITFHFITMKDVHKK